MIGAVGIEGDYVEDFDVDIDLSFLEGLDELGPMIEARVAEAMAELDVQLQKGLSFLESDRFREHVEEAADKAERAAERIAEKARAMVERETERARRVPPRKKPNAPASAPSRPSVAGSAPVVNHPHPRRPPRHLSRLRRRPLRRASARSGCKSCGWWRRASSPPTRPRICCRRSNNWTKGATHLN